MSTETEIKMTVRILNPHSDLDLRRITTVLDLKPTFSNLRGEARQSPRGSAFSFSQWGYDLPVAQPASLSFQLALLQQVLRSRERALVELGASGHRIQVHLSVLGAGRELQVYLEASLIQIVSSIGAELSISFFGAYGDDAMEESQEVQDELRKMSSARIRIATAMPSSVEFQSMQRVSTLEPEVSPTAAFESWQYLALPDSSALLGDHLAALADYITAMGHEITTQKASGALIQTILAAEINDITLSIGIEPRFMAVLSRYDLGCDLHLKTL